MTEVNRNSMVLSHGGYVDGPLYASGEGPDTYSLARSGNMIDDAGQWG